MAYTSGRTVKSSRPARPTTVASATADARKLVNRHLADVRGVTIDSAKTAHTVTLAPLVRTSITFPELDREATRKLADAIASLPGYHSMAWNTCGISFVRSI